MAIGAKVRSLFGPLEAPVTDLYRAFFVDLDRQIARVKSWVPGANSILEIGCGEGAVCQRLAHAYPQATITGIDITPKAGRLFQGDRSRVRFVRAAAEDFARDRAATFDLILMCDVLHHVPWDQRADLLRQARAMLRPGGCFVLKDWELIRNLGQAFCEFSDRVLTCDDVRFGTCADFRKLLEGVFGPTSVAAVDRIRPWRNNLIMLVRTNAT